MKTKIITPENAKSTKAFLVAGLILIQASLMAGESSINLKDSSKSVHVFVESAEVPGTLNAVSVSEYFTEEAIESELEIEDWMCNIHKDCLNDQVNEDEIELEEWMYNPQHIFWMDLTTAEEPELAIESWMANPNEWKNSAEELLLSSK